jgi:hypothetical protein
MSKKKMSTALIVIQEADTGGVRYSYIMYIVLCVAKRNLETTYVYLILRRCNNCILCQQLLYTYTYTRTLSNQIISVSY